MTMKIGANEIFKVKRTRNPVSHQEPLLKKLVVLLTLVTSHANYILKQFIYFLEIKIPDRIKTFGPNKK